jgi:3'-phosphoadenosine 5'-phosphosulfate sulfotransferase (PAPS reductase)/FAD synthetase
MRDAEHEQYRLYGQLPVHARRKARSIKIIRDAIAEIPGEWGVGASGGKDSVALAHLCRDAGWRGRLFHFRFEETPPENTALVHRLAADFGTNVVDALVPGDFTTFKKIGHFFAVPSTAEEHSAMLEGERRYKRAVEDAAIWAGFAGLFLGMRKQESRNRSIVLSKYGTLYKTKSRETWTCCPLADWTGQDVWAYLTANSLPWLSIYDDSENREHQRSETTWLGFDGLWRHGQGRQLRERDPALWRRLCLKYPDLQMWG